uniref:RNB domain-containing protein n=1 Tax=viral metagenome TaxID=1070528 RepID=A0A6C0D852_9ZZZZ
MTSFTLQIHSRNYETWSITQSADYAPSNPNYHPQDHKHFHEDVIDSTTLTIISSPLREQPYIPGILVLENNKTYGRTENKKRLLYKCIPHKKNYPAFLVPYEPTLGFSKHILNHYVIFKYTQWNDTHPRGELVETFGAIDDYQAFEKYQIHCKNLYHSIQPLNQHIKMKFKEIAENQYIENILNAHPEIQDRTSEYVFSIDNDTTTDYDDAISITQTPDTTRISVYIANVALCLDALDAWNIQEYRTSTIYLPDKKHSMLPTQLSQHVCSLVEKTKRLAITIDYIYDNSNTLVDVQYSTSIITVKKNFHYDSPKLSKNPQYHRLFEFTNKISSTSPITDSHELVAYWMVKMNETSAKLLHANQCGIFRKTTTPYTTPTENIQSNEMFLYHFTNKISSEYDTFDESKTYYHHSLNMDYYVHITSPIRRIVDLLNQICFLKIINTTLSPSATEFLNHYCQKIQKINTDAKSIRKVQMSCELMYLSTHTDIMNRTYDAMIFQQAEKGYLVYIAELKLLTKIKTPIVLQIKTIVQCKIYVFQKKDSITQKIKVDLLEN